MAISDLLYYSLFSIWFLAAALVHYIIKAFLKPPPPPRPEFGSSENFIYKGSRFILAEYGDYWRFMKKLCMTKLLSVPQLEKFRGVRESEKIHLIDSVMNSCREGKLCDFSRELTRFTNNIICRMVMSTRCSTKDNEAQEIHKLVRTFMKLAGKLHMGDILGPFQVFDFSGTVNEHKATMMKYDRLIEKILKEHEDKPSENHDLLDILLETYNDPTAEMRLTRNDIKSFLLDLFLAGTDTSSGAMQWAMAHLINSPKSFKKLREEINSVVGPNRLVQESDVPNLPYLRAVIKETLRLHPSTPLIIRECREDSVVNGFFIKSKTRMIVNLYAIMRDPESWNNPDEFIPERFLESSDKKIGEHQMDVKGQNFRFLPFGSGRRGCVGASLAMEVIHPAVGALVQCFDWKLKEGEFEVDLNQGSGFGAEMAKPLVCYPVKHVLSPLQ
ncbi:hypothetical protein ACFE04_029195 [Oxalis oulophora]